MSLRLFSFLSFPLATILFACSAVAQEKTSAEGTVIAITGGELRLAGTLGTITDGVVLIKDGTITAVGPASTVIPANAKIIDAKGMIVTPGLIDARSLLWLASDSVSASANDASLHMVDGIDPFSDDWHEVIASGVTSVSLLPSSRGSLGGFSTVVSVAPTGPGMPSVLSKSAALQSSIGVNANSNRSRQQEIDRTAKLFEGAIDYKKKWDEYNQYIAREKKVAEASSKEPKTDSPPKAEEGDPKPKVDETKRQLPPGVSGPPPGVRGPRVRPSTDGNPPAPPTAPPSPTANAGEKKEAAPTEAPKTPAPKKPELDPAKEELLRVINGEVPVRLEVHNSDDVHYAFKWLKNDKYKQLQVVFEGLSDLRSARKSIQEFHAPLILGPWLELDPRGREQEKRLDGWAADFSKYDGLVAITTSGSNSRSSRLLRSHAAVAVSRGFTPERALKAITQDAAQLLGVGHLIGTIAEGKRADLACFQGDPLNLATPVKWVMSGGEIVFDGKPSQSKTGIALDTHRSSNDSKVDPLPRVLPEKYLLKSARCWHDGTLQPVSLLIDGGKIKEIQKPNETRDTSVDGLPVFDLGQTVITPGLFSAHANLGLDKLIDPQLADSSFVVAADCLTSGFEGESSLVEGGLLSVLLAPGSSNPLSGSASLVRLGSANSIASREAAVKFVLSSKSRNTNRFPSSLAGQIQLIEDTFQGRFLESRVYLPPSVEEKLVAKRQSILNRLSSGQCVAIFEAQSDTEIQASLQFASKKNLKAILYGFKQVEPHISQLVASKSMLAVQPMTTDTYSWYYTDVKRAVDEGVAICFAGETSQQLRLTAAKLVAEGVEHDKVLRALCETPSTWLGVPQGSGVYEGARADLVMWTGSPIHLAARPLHVLIDGQLTSSEDE